MRFKNCKNFAILGYNQNMQINRAILSQLLEELENQKVLILLGARQVGKTSLMNELKETLISRDKRIKFFDLEQPKDSLFFSQDLIDLYDLLIEDVDYIFIDEFHYLENATKLFKAIVDNKKKKIKIIASGSSALEMHKHLKESLAGRKNEYIIRPLSFLEYSQTKKKLNQYLIYGGNPELVHIKKEADQIKFLKGILSTYILKDIKALIKEENITAFNSMLYHLAQNQGQIISIQSLACDIKSSYHLTEKYIDILAQTYILHKIPSFSQNLSNELKKSFKYYFYDSGIRNAILADFKAIDERCDKGSIHEQYFCNFVTANLPANAELRFWRTRNGDEIDFIVLKNRDPYLFEIKSRLKSKSVPESIKTFIRNYRNVKEAFIINEDLDFQVDYDGVVVNFLKIADLEENLFIKKILS
jgi:hypothetical protein